MKKTYLIPSTETISVLTSIVCQTAVNSVHGNGPSYGGEDNNIDPA